MSIRRMVDAEIGNVCFDRSASVTVERRMLTGRCVKVVETGQASGHGTYARQHQNNQLSLGGFIHVG